MTDYYGVVGNRDMIKFQGERLPFWCFLDEHPAGWLCSLAYGRDDVPADRPRIWDCGAWSYRALAIPHLGRSLVTPAWALQEYQRLGQAGDTVIAPDHMLIPGADLVARRRFNHESAARFLDLAAKSGLTPMAVVHGADLDERLGRADELIRQGYQALALGGLAGRVSQRAFVIETVTALRAAFPAMRLHVLGVSAPSFFRIWRAARVDSCDGASHFKQAFTGGKFFVLEDGRLVAYQAARPGEIATAPRCGCRACALLAGDRVDTRSYGSNESNMGRAAHNLNMLMRAQRAVPTLE
jgi:hypothetical protein